MSEYCAAPDSFPAAALAVLAYEQELLRRRADRLARWLKHSAPAAARAARTAARTLAEGRDQLAAAGIAAGGR